MIHVAVVEDQQDFAETCAHTWTASAVLILLAGIFHGICTVAADED